MADINYYADHIIQGLISTSGTITSGGTLTVQNGNISLGSGTGRITGVDTVSASTDAANKAYVDAHPDGTVTSVGLTSQGDAIAIIGTPVTTSGNLGITFQGDTTDYINGEGDLESFPSIPQGTVTGTGSADRVAFWNGTSSLSSDVNLYWDGTNDWLGVGTSTPSDSLTVRNGTSSTAIRINAYSNAVGTESHLKFASVASNLSYTKGGIVFRNTASSNGRGDMHFLNDSAADSGNANTTDDTKMIIKQDGNVGIGVTSPIEKLQVNGNAAIYGAIKGYVGSSSNQYLSILQSSSLTYISTGTTNETIYFGIGPVANTTNINCTGTATATNFILSSDERLKKNIKDLKPKKLDVKWKSFELKLEPDYKRVGVIAQELEKTNPEFVREDVDGTKSVAYIDLLITKIVELEARIKKLEK